MLLHPYVVVSGASLDLPIITENHGEESEHDLSTEEDEDASEDPEKQRKTKTKAHSQDNLIDGQWDPIFTPSGPSYGLSFTPYRVPKPLPYRVPTPIPCPAMGPPGNSIANPLEKDKIIFKTPNKTVPAQQTPTTNTRASLHQSLILPDENDTLPVDNNEMVNRCIQKSHSSYNIRQLIDDREGRSPLRHTFSVTSREGYDPTTNIVLQRERFNDTNIRHNDRYPEAHDVDNLDNEIMDALTMETGNLPDLSEEQSSSDESRQDDFWCVPLTAENLNYLNHILCLDQEGGEGHSLESEWEASGEGCEHLHLVLKYWNYLVLPFPELRRAVSWGQVRCYCANCQPDAQPPLAGK